MTPRHRQRFRRICICRAIMMAICIYYTDVRCTIRPYVCLEGHHKKGIVKKLENFLKQFSEVFIETECILEAVLNCNGIAKEIHERETG